MHCAKFGLSPPKRTMTKRRRCEQPRHNVMCCMCDNVTSYMVFSFTPDRLGLWPSFDIVGPTFPCVSGQQKEGIEENNNLAREEEMEDMLNMLMNKTRNLKMVSKQMIWENCHI